MKRYGISNPTLAATLAGLIALLSNGSIAQTPTPEGLFRAQIDTKAVNGKSAVTKRAFRTEARSVQLNRQKLRRGKFFVDLPGNVSFEVVRELQHEMKDDKFAWVGHARGNTNNRAVLGVSGKAVAGTFRYGSRMFKLEPRANGEHIVREVSPRDPAPELNPVPVFDPIAFDSKGQGALSSTASADGGSTVIDVMVAYTPAVLEIYGADGVEALIIQAVAETNQAYTNSGMSTRLNLVKTVLTNYTTSGDMLTDLSRLRNTSDGHMDEIHSLRDQFGADLVSLIDKQSGYCGLAYRMTGLSPFFASSAFSVVNHSCATGYYSFGHELGHNQGLHHDPATAGGSSSVFPYAFGYQDPFGDFRTIMAYNCPGGCVRVNHFSNPDILFNGEPTGDASQSNNARALDETASVVASFRQSTIVLDPPTAPSNLATTNQGDNSIGLTWSDNSDDESGFYLERATGDSAFSQLAALPANSSSYSDTQVTAGQTYTYRVRAWNSNGNSAFSDQASQWIEEEDIVIDSFPVFGAGFAHVSGDWQNLSEIDGNMFSLEEYSFEGSWWSGVSLLEYYWVLDVKPGETVTVHADAYTSSLTEVFTFAYSTEPGNLAQNRDAWIDMFVVSPWFPGELSFTLPDDISGVIFISARDTNRAPNVSTSNTLHIDTLYVRTAGAQN